MRPAARCSGALCKAKARERERESLCVCVCVCAYMAATPAFESSTSLSAAAVLRVKEFGIQNDRARRCAAVARVMALLGLP